MEKSATVKENLKNKFGFSTDDFAQINGLGISLDKIETQLIFLQNGIPKIILEKPATINDGILQLSEKEFEKFAIHFDNQKENLRLQKFVPASGAASRMFKFLSEFLNDFKFGEETINAYINRKNDKNLQLFILAKEKFPFFDEVLKVTKSDFKGYNNFDTNQKEYAFVKTLLTSEKFDFANKPKAILPFHKYKNLCFYAVKISNMILNALFGLKKNHLAYIL